MARKIPLIKRGTSTKHFSSVPMRNWLIDFSNKLIKWMENNHVASGKTIDSLTVSEKNGFFELTANQSIIYALQGRDKGKFPNVSSIKKWIGFKPNLQASVNSGEITLNSLAYVIGKKIAESGTSQPRLTENQIFDMLFSAAVPYLDDLNDNYAALASKSILNSFSKSKQFKKK